MQYLSGLSKIRGSILRNREQDIFDISTGNQVCVIM